MGNGLASLDSRGCGTSLVYPHKSSADEVVNDLEAQSLRRAFGKSSFGWSVWEFVCVL